MNIEKLKYTPHDKDITITETNGKYYWICGMSGTIWAYESDGTLAVDDIPQYIFAMRDALRSKR